MTDLVERLKEAHTNSVQRSLGSDIFLEAANEIEALKAQVDSQQLCLAEIQSVAAVPSAVTQHFSQICMMRNMAKNVNSDSRRDTFRRIQADAVMGLMKVEHSCETPTGGIAWSEYAIQEYANNLQAGE